MNGLGKSVERYKNGGAIFAFWISIAVLVFFIGFLAFAKIDSFGKTMGFFAVFVFALLTIYMYFKAKTEIDIREYGLYIRNIRKKHEILYDDIAKFDKTKRVGKSGAVIVVYYLPVIVKKDGERITFPCRISEEFITKLLEVSHKD